MRSCRGLRRRASERDDDVYKQEQSSPEGTFLNKHRLKGFAAHLCLAFLFGFLASPSAVMGSSKLTFAFSERSPPYSSTLREEAVGLFPDLVRLTFSFVPD